MKPSAPARPDAPQLGVSELKPGSHHRVRAHPATISGSSREHASTWSGGSRDEKPPRQPIAFSDRQLRGSHAFHRTVERNRFAVGGPPPVAGADLSSVVVPPAV